jgi:hypothetical protein
MFLPRLLLFQFDQRNCSESRTTERWSGFYVYWNSIYDLKNPACLQRTWDVIKDRESVIVCRHKYTQNIHLMHSRHSSGLVQILGHYLPNSVHILSINDQEEM